MVEGIGTDMADIARFRKLPFLENRHFYDSIFTPDECAYCLTYEDPYPHLAVRFAAKEAVIKAVRDKLSHKEIEVIKFQEKPALSIRGKIKNNVRLSLSHTNDYALAFAVFF